MLSTSTGDMTYIAKTTNYSQNTNPLQMIPGGSISTSTQETARKLMTDNEIENMGDNMLILIEGQPSIKGHKVYWFFSNYFKERVYDVKNPNSIISQKYQPFNTSQKIIKKI
jgi:type IV secretory pathway TraG/TraD family ATPase VirD4